MRILKPTEFQKAKYKRKWRGKNGEWQYEYDRHTPTLNRKDMVGMSAGEKMKHTAAVLTGKGLPEAAYEDVPVPPKVTSADRKRLNRSLSEALPGDYFQGIPIDKMQDAVKKEGYVLIQEDGTEWSGMFLGRDGEAFLEMGKLSEGRTVNGLPTYKPVDNSGLRMTWHKMNTAGRYEVIKYIS